MKSKQKISLALLIGSIVLILASITLFRVNDKYFSGDKSYYAKEAIQRVQDVADTAQYFIEVFPFDSLTYHEIPVLSIYQDGRLREYCGTPKYDNSGDLIKTTFRSSYSYSEPERHYVRLTDAKGMFTIDTSNHSIIKPYKKAFEIDSYWRRLGSDTNIYKPNDYYIDGLYYEDLTDGLEWNYEYYSKQMNFPLMPAGYIKVVDFNNVVSDSLLYYKHNIVKGDTTAIYDPISLFAGYHLRPYRIFYNSIGNSANIVSDVLKSFEQLNKLFLQHKTCVVDSLCWNIFECQSNFTLGIYPETGVIGPINQYYGIFSRTPDKSERDWGPFCKLGLASDARMIEYTYNFQSPWDEEIEKKYFISPNREFEESIFGELSFNYSADFNRRYSFFALEDEVDEELSDAHVDAQRFFSVSLDSIFFSDEKNKFNRQKSIKEAILRYPYHNPLERWNNLNQFYKKHPGNGFYQYITIHNEDYDVSYILTNERNFVLSNWNDDEYSKKFYYTYDSGTACAIIGGLLLLVALFLFIHLKER